MSHRILKYSRHALQRMFERDISREEVIETVEKGEVIESYPEDHPYPSALLLHRPKERALHAVVGYDTRNSAAIVVTVYEPDRRSWTEDLRRKRGRK